MEASLVGRAPGSEGLVGEHLRVGDGAEEVHAPVGGFWLVDIPQSKRDGDVGEPSTGITVDFGGRGESVTDRVGHEEMVEWSALLADFGWVVDEGLVGNVVGADLKLQVVGWVVFTAVDEGLHDVVLPDIVIDVMIGVKVEVFLLECLEVHVDGGLVVADVDLGAWEGISLEESLVELRGGGLGAARDAKGWVLGAGSLGQGSRSGDEAVGGGLVETHLCGIDIGRVSLTRLFGNQRGSNAREGERERIYQLTEKERKSRSEAMD